jgi:hypothetical protein
MHSYKPPCATGECPSEVNVTREFCETLGEKILGAGGTSAFEIYPCPYAALLALTYADETPIVGHLRKNLGMRVLHSDEDITE